MKFFSSENLIAKQAYKALDFGRGQGVVRFKHGAYTIVREYFEPVHNTANGQKMRFYKSVLGRVTVKVLPSAG
jgi:hypothetical protein